MEGKHYLFIISLFTLCLYPLHTQNKPDLQILGLRDNVQFFTESSANYKFSFGNYEEGKPELQLEIEFNENGYIIKQVKLRNDLSYSNIRETTLNDYDSIGNKIKTVSCLFEKCQSYIRSFDSNGIVQEINFEDNTEKFIKKFNYDIRGNCIEINNLNFDGTLDYKMITTINYDYGKNKDKRLKTNNYYDATGNLYKTESYLFDHQKNLIKSTEVYNIYQNKNIRDSIVINYKYDIKNTLSQIIRNEFSKLGYYNYGQPRKIDSIYYYSNGLPNRILKYEYVEYRKTWDLYYSYEYKYDNYCNIIDEIDIEPFADTSIYKYTHTFDDNYNWITRTKLKHVIKFGKQELEPQTIVYRQLTYY